MSTTDPSSISENLQPVGSSSLPMRVNLTVWAAMAVLLFLVLELHLFVALLGGLAVYELIDLLSRWLHFTTLNNRRARRIVVAVLAAGIVAGLTAVGLGITSYLRHGNESFPALLQELATALASLRARLPASMSAGLPAHAETLRLDLLHLLRTHADVLSIAGRDVSIAVVRLMTGMVIGALLALYQTAPSKNIGPLASLGGQAIRRFADAFHRVVFAQARIAAINAILAALYLLLLLPLLGIHLPMAKTIVVLTFVIDLIPIIGNLISNSFVVVLSLTASLWVVAASVAFLVFIHEMEYFLGARVVGSHIQARAWELLLAMLVLEAAFGLAGIIAAPLFYAYFKNELIEHRLI